MKYTPRVIDQELDELLKLVPLVVIEGPKAVGKTLSAIRRAKKVVRLDIDENARQLAAISPELLLAGDTPILLDEWQLVPELWRHVKVESDLRQLKGQFILTGSSKPIEDKTRDSAAGRVARLKMRPLSLFESGESNGSISLKDLFEGKAVASLGPNLTITNIAELICKGGWPSNQMLNLEQSLKTMKAYIEELASIDVQAASGVAYNASNVKRAIQSLARNVGARAAEKTIAKDSGQEGSPLDRKTTAGYLEALERVMVTENNPPWVPNLRSPARLINASVRYFVDPSIAVAALGATPKILINNQLNLLGFLFENLVVRDVRVYAQALGGHVMQYRDSSGSEVDIIIESGNGSWAAIEIKLGNTFIDQAAESLKKVKNKIDINMSGEPAFMAVVTATGSAYQRKDGIFVLPIGTLCP